MKMIFGWPEEQYHDICREYDQKWLALRHLYYSSEALAKVIAKEENNERRSTI